MGNFFEELKNRNVYKVAVAYLVTSWLLLQIVDVVGPNLGWPDSLGALLIKILIVGFPIALILTWLYEFTPKGLKLTGKVQEDTTDNRRAGRRLNRTIIGVLAITLCLMLVERFFFAGNVSINARQQASIAVLPFVNMSAEEENEYFADGLTDQILDELASLSGLQVPARTSSFKFKDRNEDIREIAEFLGVNYVLEGSVQYESKSNRIKITAQLINASNGYHLWSQTYEDDFEEIFEIQEDVGRKVASELRVKLLPGEEKALSRKLTDNSEAYKLFLQSREYSQLRSDEPLEKGIELLKQAIKLEPNFAEAHAELSFLYHQRYFYGTLPKKVRDEKMKHHLDKALALAPDLPEVIRTNNIYKMLMREFAKDSSDIIKKLRKALEVKPNYADGHFNLYSALMNAGQPELAHQSLVRTVELDPLNDFYTNILARDLFFQRNEYEKALALADRQLIIDPDNQGMALFKSLMLLNEPFGDFVSSFRLLHNNLKTDPYARGNLNYTLLTTLDLDLWPYAEKMARSLQLKYPT